MTEQTNYTQEYPNLFAELGYAPEEITNRTKTIFDAIF